MEHACGFEQSQLYSDEGPPIIYGAACEIDVFLQQGSHVAETTENEEAVWH
jgi:hypothetical protein